MIDLLLMLVVGPAVVDEPTYDDHIIEVSATLEEVIAREKQSLLADLGWYEGAVDGIHGPLTDRALEEFTQAAEVEPESWLELVSELRADDAPLAPEPEPEPEPVPVSSPEPSPQPAPAPQRNVWDRLADCESGNWVDGGRSFEEGSARWGWGGSDPIPPWGTSIHDGGLQFHPGTWSAFKLDGYPDRAFNASREQQIAVAERVLDAQGWGAWPTCARKLGLR